MRGLLTLPSEGLEDLDGSQVMAGTKPTSKAHVFEVEVSFSALNKGDVFSQEPDDWSDQHTKTGYLRDLTAAEEARNAGEVGQG
jgi:hypothetical protein